MCIADCTVLMCIADCVPFGIATLQVLIHYKVSKLIIITRHISWGGTVANCLQNGVGTNHCNKK